MNKLSLETSPYLLQHAHNPVHWHPWGEEAFEKARREDKPILVSIGYSTCHWCHVMERESFENEDIAALMNEYFVNIKVDREERPDVDQVYMEAVQAMTGGGGWPLNCFLMPDGKPFYGGTYFPPRPAHGRASWGQVLISMNSAWREQREVVIEQAEKLMDMLRRSEVAFTDRLGAGKDKNAPFDKSFLESTYFHLRERFDRLEGGFGGAPKFPGTMSLEFLLRCKHFMNNQEALEHANLSLKQMIYGGIYDQLGGGFARYSTDREWLVPHFEKMLYDNALLVSVLSEAYQLMGNDLYRETIEETLEYVRREMTAPEGGFYSAQDADSEGVEGKFFVWKKEEIEDVLGDYARLFCEFYDVTDEGNWEHQNILNRANSYTEHAALFGPFYDIDEARLRNILADCRKKLFEVRHRRVYPGLDDKQLLDWNALMISAHAKAALALGRDDFKNTAIEAMRFVLEKFRAPGDGLAMLHSYKNGQAKYNAFLDDYANLIAALLDVYALDFDTNWLALAQSYANFVRERFYDERDGFYFFTTDEAQKDLPMRKKDLYDNATPSGNSTMMHNLFKISILNDNANGERELATQLLERIKNAVEQYPNAFGRYASGLFSAIYPSQEVAIVGPHFREVAAQVQRKFLPNTTIMASAAADDRFPLLAGKEGGGKTLIYVCRDYACLKPVETVEEALAALGVS